MNQSNEKAGQSWDDQQAELISFKSGAKKVLVATTVAEEGLGSCFFCFSISVVEFCSLILGRYRSMQPDRQVQPREQRNRHGSEKGSVFCLSSSLSSSSSYS